MVAWAWVHLPAKAKPRLDVATSRLVAARSTHEFRALGRAINSMGLDSALFTPGETLAQSIATQFDANSRQYKMTSDACRALTEVAQR